MRCRSIRVLRPVDFSRRGVPARQDSWQLNGDQFFVIHASNNGKVMISAGGISLEKDGEIVGAIVISGGSGEQDHAVAEAGASAL